MVNDIIFNLRNIRRSKNIKQKAVACFCGISQPAISRIEAGDIDPNISMVVKMCNFLEVKMVLISSMTHDDSACTK